MLRLILVKGFLQKGLCDRQGSALLARSANYIAGGSRVRLCRPRRESNLP